MESYFDENTSKYLAGLNVEELKVHLNAFLQLQALTPEQASYVAHMIERLECLEQEHNQLCQQLLDAREQCTQFESYANEQAQNYTQLQTTVAQLQHSLSTTQSQLHQVSTELGQSQAYAANMKPQFDVQFQAKLDEIQQLQNQNAALAQQLAQAQAARAHASTIPQVDGAGDDDAYENPAKIPGHKLKQAALKNLPLPTFDGKDVVDWRFQVQQYISATEPDAPEETKIAIVGLLFKGRALTWWKSKVQANVKYSQLDVLLKAVQTEFIDHQFLNKLRREFEALDMVKCNNNIASYVKRARDLIYQMADEAPKDGHQVWRFKEGLTPQIRAAFSGKTKPKNLNEAIELAEEIAQDQSAAQSKMQARTPTTATANFAHGIPQQYAGSKRQNKGTSNSGFNQNNAAWKKNAVCHYCGKKGHIKPECRKFQADNSAGNVQNNNSAPASQQAPHRTMSKGKARVNSASAQDNSPSLADVYNVFKAHFDSQSKNL